MNEKIFKKLNEMSDGYGLDENEMVQIVEGIFWDEYDFEGKHQECTYPLNVQFYENCLEALQQFEIKDEDLILYEALSTMLDAISNKAKKSNNIDITEEELDVIRKTIYRLIYDLKIKYEKKIKEEYIKVQKDYAEKRKTKEFSEIYKSYSEQEKALLLLDNFENVEDEVDERIEEALDFSEIKKLCKTKEEQELIEELEEIKDTIVENIRITAIMMRTGEELLERYEVDIDLDDFKKIVDGKKTGKMSAGEIVNKIGNLYINDEFARITIEKAKELEELINRLRGISKKEDSEKNNYEIFLARVEYEKEKLLKQIKQKYLNGEISEDELMAIEEIDTEYFADLKYYNEWGIEDYSGNIDPIGYDESGKPSISPRKKH